MKQGNIITVQNCSGKCLREEREILNRWTEYSSELYNHKANGDPSVLNCPQTHTEDDHPILRKEVEATVQSLKKGNNNVKRCMKEAKEKLIGEQSSETEENLRKNNSKRVYQLVKDLYNVDNVVRFF